MALLPGLDYPVAAVFGPLTINDNQVSPSVLISLSVSLQPTCVIEYSISRGTIQEVGRILVSTNSTTPSLTVDNTGTASSGVTLSPVIVGSTLEIQYTSTSTGQAAQFWYTITTVRT